jgi:hypothetical protein
MDSSGSLIGLALAEPCLRRQGPATERKGLANKGVEQTADRPLMLGLTTAS